MKPNVLVPAALFGYFLVAILFFAFMPVRRAVAACMILGFLFLPVWGYDLKGLPSYDKFSAISLATLLGCAMFDFRSLARMKPQWYDIPAAVFCFVPLASSITNDLGIFDGLSSSFEYLMMYGVPYLIGRAYFNDLSGVRDLAIVMVLGGLIYAPIVAWEARMAPTLHHSLYGFSPFPFHMAIRLGGYRPVGFMMNGLQTGLWMCASAVTALMLWQARSRDRVLNFSMSMAAVVVSLAAVLCRSTGALVLMAMALVVGVVGRWVKLPVLLVILSLLPVGYMTLRGTEAWSGQNMVEVAKDLAGAQRAQSLAVRFRNERVLTDKAMQRPLFGWGGWSRNRVDMQESGFRSITDGLWVILIGQRGLAGIVTYTLMMTLPVLLYVSRFRALAVTHPWFAPGTALCLVLAMYNLDTMLNAMVNPIYTVIAGALMGLVRDARVFAAVRGEEPTGVESGAARRVPVVGSALAGRTVGV